MTSAAQLLGDHVPLVVVGGRAALVDGDAIVVGDLQEVMPRAAAIEAGRGPRWVVFSAAPAVTALLAARVRIGRCWDIAEAHRIINGGWSASPQLVWATLTGAATGHLPSGPAGDLFDYVGQDHALADPDPDSPLRPDGYLRPEAFDPGWAWSDVRLAALARLARDIASRQHRALEAVGPRAVRTTHSESAAAVLCVELERDGLPVDRACAEELITDAAGRRPADEHDAARIRRERDEEVLGLLPGHTDTDLRNPAQVRELLAAVGLHVPNTRKWTLEPFRERHPLVGALLAWRRDERIATTYGYRWLDQHVGQDGRLRGAWSACDGAAGRMTAQHGLHNLPSPLRPAIAAQPGHVFVRADLGQIEPRVLAVVSGDRGLTAATLSDDLYAPVAAKLGTERAVAKVAVLAAMYGQRSGVAGEALRDLERAYPVAMSHLDDAYAAGVGHRELRTFGGRLVAVPTMLRPGGPTVAAPGAGPAAIDAARGRFARNAIIQGSAAELFKAWAATVRHGVAELDGQIVLCLHDELLVHVPEPRADEARARVLSALADSARRWSGTDQVRFVADASIIRRWSEAKT